MATKYRFLTPEALVSLSVTSIILFILAYIYIGIKAPAALYFFTLAVIAIAAFSAAGAEITYSKPKAWLKRSAFVGIITSTFNFILYLILLVFSGVEFFGALLFSLIFASSRTETGFLE